MQQESITNAVMHDLARSYSPDDILLALCQATGISWAEASRWIDEIRSIHRDEIRMMRITWLLKSILKVVLGVNLILLLILALTGNEEAGSSHRSFAHHPWGSPLGKWLQLILAFLYLIYPAGFLSSAVIVPLAMLLLVIMITLGFKAYR